MTRLRPKHTLEFPFDGDDYRVRFNTADGQAEGLREYAIATEDGWMALEPSAQLTEAADVAAQHYIEAGQNYLQTGF